MAYFEWREEFSVGIASVDGQHQQLVKMLNDLHEATQRGQGQEVLGKVVKDLAHYCLKHFSHEESLMISHGYPGYQEHLRMHEKLTAEVKGMIKEYNQGNAQLANTLVIFLKDWLIKHILHTDQKYGLFLQAKGAV